MAAAAAAAAAQSPTDIGVLPSTTISEEVGSATTTPIIVVPKKRRDRKRSRDYSANAPDRRACPSTSSEFECEDENGNRPCQAAQAAGCHSRAAERVAKKARGERAGGALPHDPACPNRRANRARASKDQPLNA